MWGMFAYCSAMTVPPAVGGWDTGAVTDMNQTFAGCQSMTEPPAVGSWSTGAVTTMYGMFYNCSKMTEPPAVGSWNTGRVTNMYKMFSGCSAMTEPPSVGSWNTGAVTDMGVMFDGCSKMTSLDVSRWDFSKVASESDYLGLQNCSALRELKVPSGAKVAGLPEHAAQGEYAATWGNAERSITGSTAANLVSTVNAGNGAGTWKWEPWIRFTRR
jgi:surface protein